MPTLELKSNVKPSTFAYPPPIEVAKKEEKERVATAILSVTAKAKRREAEKAKIEPMEVDEVKEEVKEEEKEVKKEEEKNWEVLKNPARVMKQQVRICFGIWLNFVIENFFSQLRYLEMTDPRWKPVKDVTSGGIILVKDNSPGEVVEFVQPVAGE